MNFHPGKFKGLSPMLRDLVEQLVLECFGKNAYMMLACSSASTTLTEEWDAERVRYGDLWNYVGD